MQTPLDLSLFKAYDIRTPARLMTAEVAERLARAEAVYLREVLQTPKVLLGRDARLTGPRYLEIGARVFEEAGFEVLVNPQVTSTCHFYYSCMRHPDAAGILYGASHNPGGDTGQKLVGPGVFPIAEDCGPGGGLTAIRRLFTEGRSPAKTPGGRIDLFDYQSDFVDYSLALAGVGKGDLQGCRILVDFLSGAAGADFIRALRFAGAELEIRNFVPDGHFPSGAPNPVVRESIQGSLDRLKAGGFHFALFFDGDGDRIDFIAPDGRQLSPSFNFSALAPSLLGLFEKQGALPQAPQVFVDLKANPLAITFIAKQGLGVHVIRNGHSQIKESLRKGLAQGFLGAVEESAHYYLNYPLEGRFFPSENTLFYGLLTAKAWHRNPALFEELLRLQGSTFREREWGHVFPGDAQRAEALLAVEAAFKAQGAGSMSRTADGQDMEATLIREGLPFVITRDTPISAEWTQVAQRISQSEKGLARWEVSAGTAKRKEEAVRLIEATISRFGAGPRYIG